MDDDPTADNDDNDDDFGNYQNQKFVNKCNCLE